MRVNERLIYVVAAAMLVAGMVLCGCAPNVDVVPPDEEMPEEVVQNEDPDRPSDTERREEKPGEQDAVRPSVQSDDDEPPRVETGCKSDFDCSGGQLCVNRKCKVADADDDVADDDIVSDDDSVDDDDIVSDDDVMPDDDECTRWCFDYECGDDGCGGSCGECGEGATCESHVCVPDGSDDDTIPVDDDADDDDVCVRDCYDRQCGDDGCGGSCGSCYADEICDPDGKCFVPPPSCPETADCSGLECGPDPICGIDCGACGEYEDCIDGACVDNGLGHCFPDCTGIICGPDPICGSNCGTCGADEKCDAGQCVCADDLTACSGELTSKRV